MNWRRLTGWAVVGAIVLISMGVATALVLDQRADQERRERAEVKRVASVLEAISTLTTSQLDAIASYIQLEPNLTDERFQAISRSLVSEQPLVALYYVRAAGRPTPRAIGRHDGIAYVTVHSSAGGPLGSLRTETPEEARHLAETFGDAHEDEAVSSSRAVDIDGPLGDHLVLARPVDIGPAAPPSGAPAAGAPRPGLATGAISVAALIAAAREVAPSGTRLALVEESGEILEGGELLVADDDGGGDAATGDFTATPIVIADRGLELRLDTPTTGMVLVPILIGLIGLILAVAISLVLLNWSRRERVALELAQRRVTERDRALQAEAETNKMYRLLAENLTDTVMVTDREARITYASPACESMMGWRPSELVGKLVIELLHPDEAEKGLSRYRQLLAEPGVVTFEHRVLCKDGEYVWVESAIRSVEDEEGRGEIVELQSTTRDISERKPLQDRLERLASEDSLTGLCNRRRFRESLEAELARSRRGGAVGSLLMIDIDNFKDFNDTYGHLVGDTVIQSVAEVLEERVRVSDTLARLGGDEFSAILPETDPGEAEVLAKAIVEAVGRHPVGHDLEPVTVSVGIASFGGGAELVADAVLTRADQAMYRAKRLGRNRIVRFDVTGDRDGDGTSVRPGQAAGTPAG